MTVLRFVQVMALAVLTASAQQNFSQQSSSKTESERPASCPVDPRPAKAFIPPAPYQTELPDDVFWIGTEKLWTELRGSMQWGWRPHSPGHEKDLTAKVFWFRVGYSWRTEPIPKIKVTGRRLDGPAPALMLPQGPATNVIIDNSGRGAMLTGVYVPVPGCWEITGDYEGDKLSFVVWVKPVKQANQ